MNKNEGKLLLEFWVKELENTEAIIEQNENALRLNYAIRDMANQKIKELNKYAK